MASHQQSYEAAQTIGCTEAAKDKALRIFEASREEKSGGVLQQTGEHIKNMAQGAADAVKDSFGFAEQTEDDDLPTKNN
ncbi:hypothetical protein LIER_29036 [Lithospermum erythrorhizon]|uniref:Late embryogenesis abundant protein 1-like n=1 Tax=Lithospermum erythrorhizon TaxID=34254 RepID=A0AAV3RHT8_LITER